MNKINKISFFPVMAVLLGLSGQVFGVNCSTNQNGNWNTAAIWTGCVGGNGATANTPGTNDNVTIAHNVSLNGANRNALSLTINSGTLTTSSNSVTIVAGTGVLIVDGTILGNGNVASRVIKNSSGNFSGTGSINNLNDLTIAGDTTIAAGTNLTFTGAECQLNLSANVDVINNGTLTFNAAACGTSRAIALANPATFTNNGSVTTGTVTGANATASIWTNAANSTLNVSVAVLATGRLNASANPNTVHYNGTGNQTVKLAFNGDYYHLTVSGGGSKAPAAGTHNILGDLTINTGPTFNVSTNDPTINVTGNVMIDGIYTASNNAARALTIDGNMSVGGTYTGNTAPVNLAGNFTRTGTFTSGTGLFTFNGTAAQALTGATTFTNMQMNATGLTINNDVTVAAVLTLTSGNIATGTNTLIVTAACLGSVARTAGFVIGNLRKAIPAGASTCTFEVGSGANYTPIVTVFVAGTTAGNITGSTTGTEHGSIASSGIDATKSVNRYWTLTNGSGTLVTLPAAGFTARFNYINGSPVDYDLIGTPANFIVERWNGTNWFPTTLNATCTATPGTNLCEQVNGLTAAMFGDFATGEQAAGFNANPGAFNVFETTTPVGVLGRLFTKRVGTGTFAVSIVAVSNNAVNATPATTALTVDVIDASPTGGTLTAASNCRTTWITVIQTQTVPAVVAWASGRINVNITAPTQAVRNARIRVTQGGNVGCSTDNFSIRPAAFTVTSTNATQTGSSGTPIIKTGANFNLTATALAGYDGTPSLNNTLVSGTPIAGTISGSFGAAPIGTGIAAGNSFFYSEVGNFGLGANGVFDAGFTGVDSGSGDCTNDFSNSLVGGRYGCSFGSTAVTQTTGSSGFGRFIPDNFNVSYGTPVFATACTGFNYVGQTFIYTTVPVLTMTARAGTNNGLTNQTTTNYAGNYMKFTNASLAQTTYATQAGRYTRFDVLGGGSTPTLDVSGLPATTADPAIGTFTNGVGTLTFAGGSGLAFTRGTTTPSALFNADIALALNVIDTDNVIFTGNPASFGAATAGNGIGFSDGNAGTTTDQQMRYGRLRLGGASGSSLLPLRIPVEAQYWNGTSFVTNGNDDCTALASANVGLGNSIGGIVTSVTAVTSPLQKGRGVVTLAKPGGTSGSIDVAVNLGPVPPGTATADACSSLAPAATAANKSYLRGNWCNPPGTYTKDPSTRARFGIQRGSDEVIYMQERPAN
jgi:hypothetical protein